MPKCKINPKGFFKEFLKTQISGLTGNIGEAGYPFNKDWWGTDDELEKAGNPAWWQYEQTAYWLDGYTRCGILLNDKDIIEKVSKRIYNVILHPDKDGYLGPQFMKKTDGWNRWPHVVFFRACMALYAYNNDKKIVLAITNHYLGRSARHIAFRDVLNIEIMLWAYGINGNKALLEMAENDYKEYNKTCTDDNCVSVALSDKLPVSHGVSYNEFSKLGAILYKYTGNIEYLKASINAYKKVEDNFMLPSGCHTSNEFLCDNDCMQSYETCNITDYTWALNYMFEATFDTKYADSIERCVFNGGMGSVLENFRGLQYFSCVNQVVADSTSNHNLFYRGSKWMSYRPNPGTECCPGNVNRFMPNYIMNMWKEQNDDIFCVLYGASEFNNGKIKIVEETKYPFKETFKFTVTTNEKFNLYLRFPSFMESATLDINNKHAKCKIEGGFIKIAIKGDTTISLAFASEIEKHLDNGGIFFTKGVLTYALGEKGKREIDTLEERYSKDFPAYNIYAEKKWNYGVRINTPTNFIDGNANWFDLDEKLPRIEIEGFTAHGWEINKFNEITACSNLYNYKMVKKQGEFKFTPNPIEATLFDKEKEKLVLYPFGACKMRITVFPIKK